MLKRFLALTILASSMVACASWFGGSSAPDNPTVGSKDSSDFLFGQAASAPAASSPAKALRPANASGAIDASGIR